MILSPQLCATGALHLPLWVLLALVLETTHDLGLVLLGLPLLWTVSQDSLQGQRDSDLKDTLLLFTFPCFISTLNQTII